jgi:hypothetical protein
MGRMGRSESCDMLRLALLTAHGEIVHLLMRHGLPHLPRHRKVRAVLGGLE